jgi:hypothetical protein
MLLTAGLVSFPVAVGMAAIHGIYSLSTLELWSLSEGSYSLSMLARLAQEPMSAEKLVSLFRAPGDQKKSARLEALKSSGQITIGENVALTNRGRRMALALLALRRLANFSNPG